MTNKEFQLLLKKYPDDIPVRLLPQPDNEIIDFTEENIMHSSEGAWLDNSGNPDKWDTEDGKIRHKGRRFLLLNPIIT